ncbi:subunit alpha of signal recognition particle receptor [Chloropicon primus]|uniref:Subunit alpha of signal recognition particle receptor n=1 Tax=Chloropicon primus TaxID=1764295 RepID=A0A5B8MQD8_9CHLO|nr:subunit alpha of signal recognition particle receptor [Chloropicon primus]UPR01045.1 subunit alpha of signal recognition particle receptor [Chloropicon primus]|eukprot:QDZ21825.1 subunit alpha of signal recognition particle receptor [Chloropicon primus]
MLDYFSIFTLGGSVLWSHEWNGLVGNPINALVEECLIDQRATKKVFKYSSQSVSYTLKWTQNNELGLVFVAVYRSVLTVPYVEELLKRVKNRFEYVFLDSQRDYGDFSSTFQDVLARCEEERTSRVAEVSSSEEGEGEASSPSSLDIEKDAVMVEKPVEDAVNDLSLGEDTGGEEASQKVSGGFDTDKLKALRGKKKGNKSEKPQACATSSKKPSSSTGKAKKGGRKWGRWGNMDDGEQLDYTNESERLENANVEKATGKSMMDEDEDEGEVVVKETSWLGGMMKNLNKKINVSGQAVLEESDVKPILETLKDKLISKNVAEEVAQKIVNTVESNMVGKKLTSFTRVTTAVTKAVESALTQILSPGRNINILQEVEASRREGEPYSIVFIGCNGVGKSTNLAKVAFWLMQHGMKVMIAACDTFRSGAVEQLRTHTQRLGVELFERGYEKDPAAVAKEALKKAKESRCDVLLIDTAGRMQDNEPLMRALSKLINMNNPNLTLFVGEALVGNEAVDQLTKFNNRLIELSSQDQPHKIDGIVLTKFDTIDNKVGAALSMVYISGAPVIFVGCGQQYSDLRRLNVKQIVSVLLS